MIVSRAILKRAIFLALLAAFVAVVGPWPISGARFEAEPAGIETLARARAAGKAVREEAAGAAGTLEAGFAREEIVVLPGTTLAGYGRRARSVPHTAIHDPCYVRAIALRNGGGPPALILGGDVLYVNALVRGRVLEALAQDPKLPPERVFFTATHNHSGPGNWAETFAEGFAVGRYQDESTRRLVQAFVAAGRRAVADLRPAFARPGRVQARDLVVNRYFEQGHRKRAVVDGELAMIEIERKGEQPPAALIAFGAHATVVGADRPLVSADWPGGLARALERDGGRPLAFFAAAAVGSQAPRDDKARQITLDPFDRADWFGRQVASRIPRIALGEEAASFGLRTFEIDLPPPALRVFPGLRLSPVLARTQLRERDPVSVLRIGRELWIGFPAEISGEVAMAMKAAAKRRGLDLTVLSFAGGYHGYVLQDDYWSNWRYENWLSLHGPHFASYLVAIAEAVIEGAAP